MTTRCDVCGREHCGWAELNRAGDGLMDRPSLDKGECLNVALTRAQAVIKAMRAEAAAWIADGSDEYGVFSQGAMAAEDIEREGRAVEDDEAPA